MLRHKLYKTSFLQMWSYMVKGRWKSTILKWLRTNHSFGQLEQCCRLFTK